MAVDLFFETFHKGFDLTRSFVHKHWKRLLRIRERIRFSEETFHLMLAGIVGIVGGVTNLIFHYCVEAVKAVSLRNSGDLVDVAYSLNHWQRLLIPTLGGLVAGSVLYWGLRLVGPQGPSNFIEVVVAGDGRIRMRSGLVKALSSLISIGTGASIGREGAIAQLSAMFASKGGQVLNWQPYRLRLLVACGAASGISAAYNAPIAGAVFAAQIVLGNFSMNLFAPIIFASVVATMVSRSFFGLKPLYEVPAFEFDKISQLPWFLVLGALSGVLGAAFLKILRYSEDRFSRLEWPIYQRVAIGGLLVGALATVYPEVWGNGYSVANRILHENLALWFILGILLAKLLATAAAVGSGAVGGVFTPTLFLGAALGSLFGTVLDRLGWSPGLHVAAFAIVGMGSVLSATVHSPLLALIMVFEISLNYSVMPALMLACVVSTIVARRLHPASVYTEPLRRRGVEPDRDSQQLGAATATTVGDLMREPVSPLRETARFREIADRFLTSPNNFLPVVDAQRKLLGYIALQDLKEYLGAGDELNSVIAYDVMRPPPRCLTPSQRLIEVVPILLASEQRNVPVVDNNVDFRLVGAVIRSEALGMLSQAIAAGTTTKSPT